MRGSQSTTKQIGTALDSSSIPERYLALSGGGFNAQSSHAGLLAGAMDALAKQGKDGNIDNLLGHVKKLASSSGGTWFSTLLAYTDGFRSQFESKTGRDGYTTTGYNGKLRKIFEGLGYNTDGSYKTPAFTGIAKYAYGLLKDGIDAAISAAAKVTAIPEKTIRTGLDTALFSGAMSLNTIKESGLSWLGFVNNYVNKPLGLDQALQGLTMTSPHQPWAQDVDLILPGVLQTTKQTLGTYGLLGVYRATHTTTPKASVPSQVNFTPVLLSSRAVSSPASKPIGQALFTAGEFTSTYQSERPLANPKPITKTIPANLSNQLPIATVSAISSAAAGMMAGPIALTSSLFDSPTLPKIAKTAVQLAQDALSDVVNGLAPAVSINKGVLGPVPTLDETQQSTKGAAEVGVVRMADSGYVDNSAVAYLLRDIQDSKGTTQPFNITLWMQSNEKPDAVTGLQTRVRIANDPSKLSSFGLPSEVPLLFGQSKGDGSLDGDRVINPLSAPGLPIYVPSPKVFDPAAWYGKDKPDWSYSKDNIDLSYFKLPVTTVANNTFGVKAGQSGTLHIFNATNRESFAAPLTYGYLNEYDQNYNVIRDAIANQGGFDKLKDALGLSA